jgi:2-polyprenyl-3-methyl-5-hydroxy-6-metoxy-1,4-benzoquinol methylase
MNCCQCQGIEDLFDERAVARELAAYCVKGPAKTTRWLADALKAAGVSGATQLDIGGGIGALQHALIEAGVKEAVDVDASKAYLQAARSEAERRGIAERVSFRHGNFVDMAAHVSPADIVTLDRVVCCYPDVENLVGLSAARARKLYGLVYPRDTWWVKIGISALNLFFKLQRKPFRTFAHPTRAVDAIVRRHGLRPRFSRKTLVWQVVVYVRHEQDSVASA